MNSKQREPFGFHSVMASVGSRALALAACGGASPVDDSAQGPGGKADDVGAMLTELDPSKPQWLRLQGESPADGAVAGERFVEIPSWAELRAAREALVAGHAEARPHSVETFDHSSHGFAGLPYVLLKAMPYLAPDIFGPPESDFARFGFWYASEDDRATRPLPMGLGWRPTPLCPEGTTQKAFSAACIGADGSALPADRVPMIDKVTLTCSGCHSGQVELENGEYMAVRGAPNTTLDVRAWRLAFEQVAERYAERLANDQLGVQGELEAAIVAAADARGGLFNGMQTAEQEARQVGLYLAPVAEDSPLHIGTLIFAGTVQTVSARAEVLDALQAAAYSGSGKPRFDFGYPGSTDAAGEALAIMSSLFGGEGGINDISTHAGMVDFMSVFNQGHRPDSNWDNVIDESTSRTQTAQIATTGTVNQLDLQASSLLTEAVRAMPPVAYPFDVNEALAKRGRAVFDEHCVDCHHPGNPFRYGEIGTDLNRYNQFNEKTWASTVKGLRATCPQGTKVDGRNEGSDRPCEFEDDAILSPTPQAEGADRGYGATALHATWSASPYLHNGSVLTLFELLVPSARRAVFVRGTLKYDQEWVGFEDGESVPLDRRIVDGWKSPRKGSHGEKVLRDRFRFDTRSDGLSNAGHDADLDMVKGAGMKTYKLNWDDQVLVGNGGRPLPRPDSELAALLEYLKTL